MGAIRLIYTTSDECLYTQFSICYNVGEREILWRSVTVRLRRSPPLQLDVALRHPQHLVECLHDILLVESTFGGFAFSSAVTFRKLI